MTIKLMLGAEYKRMSTDNGVPHVGDTVEFTPGVFAEVVKVTWKLTAPPHYEKGYITHEANVTLLRVPSKKRQRRVRPVGWRKIDQAVGQ